MASLSFCRRIVGDEKVGYQRDQDCEDPFKDEYPPPAMETTDSVHVGNTLGPPIQSINAK